MSRLNFVAYVQPRSDRWAVLRFMPTGNGVIFTRKFAKLTYELEEPILQSGEGETYLICANAGRWVNVRSDGNNFISLSIQEPVDPIPPPVELTPMCFGPCEPFETECNSGVPVCNQSPTGTQLDCED